MTIKRECALEFDEGLNMLMDCDYYKRMYDKYGKPNFSKKITVTIYTWEGQTQKHISTQNLDAELAIVKGKFGNSKKWNFNFPW